MQPPGAQFLETLGLGASGTPRILCAWKAQGFRQHLESLTSSRCFEAAPLLVYRGTFQTRGPSGSSRWGGSESASGDRAVRPQRTVSDFVVSDDTNSWCWVMIHKTGIALQLRAAQVQRLRHSIIVQSRLSPTRCSSPEQPASSLIQRQCFQKIVQERNTRCIQYELDLSGRGMI